MEIMFARLRGGIAQYYFLQMPLQPLSSDALRDLCRIRFQNNKGASSPLMEAWALKFGINRDG